LGAGRHDEASRKLASRPKLVEALRIARDELIITKLDRLGCSLEHLIGTDLDW
jgi:DNA invertase Pin-like site-specific DNA recombinase